MGGVAGIATGLVMFKSKNARVFTTFFGLGAGAGSNYGQLELLYAHLKGDVGVKLDTKSLLAEIDDIEKEMKMRSKLNI